MKRKLYILIIPIFLSLLMSCESFVEGWDESPNNPTKATPALLLTNAEVCTYMAYTGEVARATAILVQQCTGTSDQMFDIYQNYNITENESVNLWQHLYESCMHTSNTIMTDYEEGHPYYTGMAKVLMAINLGLTTDLWGDVPYKEAFKGLEGEVNFHPHFESQEQILNTIQTLLDEGIAELSKPATDNKVRPGTDDVIFGGNPESWIKIAWIVKARYAMRLTKRNEASAISNALSYLNSAYSAGLSGSADDMDATFNGSGNDQNQWYAFEINRPGYERMNESFVNTLKQDNDPRLTYYVSPTNSQHPDSIYLGAPMGSNDPSTYSMIGEYFSLANSSLPLVTFSEAKFIEAEAQFRKGDKSAAANSYNQAVIAAVEKVLAGGIPEAFKQSKASETDATITLEKIMNQKYIAMFTQPEVWSDWRRTGYPSIQPFTGASGINSIPRRFPYDQSERTNNINFPGAIATNVPVWWDAQ